MSCLIKHAAVEMRARQSFSLYSSCICAVFFGRKLCPPKDLSSSHIRLQYLFKRQKLFSYPFSEVSAFPHCKYCFLD